MSLTKFMKKNSGKYNFKAANGGMSGDIEEFIDTGSYVLNALVSGSIYQGLAEGRWHEFSGESSAGKSMMLYSTIKQFLARHPENIVVMFETEGAIGQDQLEAHGLDTSRIFNNDAMTIEDLRTDALQLIEDLKANIETADDKGGRVLIVIDSLSQISTNAEIGKVTEGKNTRDFSKNTLVKGFMRLIAKQCGPLKITGLIISQVYTDIMAGQYAPFDGMVVVLTGATKYSLTTSTYFKKNIARGRDVGKGSTDKTRAGQFIRSQVYKSRLCREETEVKVLIDYTKGISRYYGIFEHAKEWGLIKKVGNMYLMPGDDKKYSSKEIISNPEKYFTEDFLAKLDLEFQKRFRFGENNTDQNLI